MRQAYKQIILTTLVLIFTSLIALAKDAPQYAVDKIPDELKKNANAVVRTNDVVFEILSDSKAHQEVKFAITILKENAIDESVLVKHYDKFVKVNEISGTIYDKDGKRVKRIKKEDILDYSAIQGFSIYEDNRIKAIDPEYMTLPFTIEYTYSVDYKSLFFMPSWYVFSGYNIAVQHTSFTVTTPKSYNFRYKEYKLDKGAEINESVDKKVYHWEYKDFKALTSEPLSPPTSIIYPYVHAEPSNFTIDDYTGDFSSWNDLGQFIYALNKEQNELPIETQNEIKELVKEAKDDYEKVNLIYQYSQKKNRYISVQVGIGGWQPFPAETVDRLSYGDCKALSNYIKSLLAVVDIESNYTLVRAGNSIKPIDPSFPSNNFNHAFLCVPLPNDTIWLECTSNTSPCGYSSDFTDDRNVLLIENNGGKLIKTPAYTAEQNRQNTTCTVQFADNFNLNIDAQISYSGANYGDEYHLMHRDEKDRRKSIINRIDIPNFKLIDYKLCDDNSRNPVFTKSLQLEASSYCTIMGNRKLLKLNLLNAFNSVPNYARKRKNPVHIQRNYSECDTVCYELPDDFKVEALPKKMELNTKYGLYKSNAEVVDGNIMYYRYLQINKGTYPKEEFNDFREFLKNVSSADNAKTVLIPKT